MEKTKRHVKRAGIAIVGSLVLLVGIVAIPYPGPGWLIVFAGLAILATEFTWAQRLLEFGKEKYDAWVAWVKRQSPTVKASILLVTSIIVVGTIWLLNGFGLINDLLNLPFDWVRSPLFA